ncbi:uncharacterized protein LOC111628217 [Centruroides sculpturatus]|uniref:uncharacterized protein LOC111628217 n=1 Tax=Centruroides sculpturatus TaxID=218467 RepID=UPI000C6E78F1|nr:uncharacterized protein LOC111628217 [Centruroides sculpturatus]
MMKYFILIIAIVHQISLLESVAPSSGNHFTKPGGNKLISIHNACSRRSLMTLLVMEEPFYGTVYAKGYPMECRETGSGSRELRITIGIDECGTKITENEDGSLVYEVLLYIQHDRQVQLATDEHVAVRCTPREIVVTTATGKQLPKEAKPSEIVKPLDYWMDIMKGRMPGLKIITGHVDVGEEVTMIIKIRQKPGIVAKVTNCLAHDGSRDNQQQLTDRNGCSLDFTILPELQEKVNGRTGLKVVYATFPAFKFPDKDNLHLQCRVLICNGVCPLQPCNTKANVRFSRSSKGVLYRRNNILNEFNVFNSVEVKAPAIDDNELIKNVPNKSAKVQHFKADMLCLSSTRIVIVVLLLLTVLMVSLVITICMCVRTRELRRRISKRTGMSYRVMDYT